MSRSPTDAPAPSTEKVWAEVPQAGPLEQAIEHIDQLAETVLRQFQDELASSPEVSCEKAFSADVADAIYAWGVVCFEQKRFQDAALLFGVLQRRQPPSARYGKAMGATHLVCSEPGLAASAFAQAHRLDPTDAEAVFHWAQAELLLSHRSEALQLLDRARDLARSPPGSTTRLVQWCDDLMTQIVDPASPDFPSPSSRNAS